MPSLVSNRKYSLLSFCSICLLLMSLSVHASEQWECAIDLQQGDTGGLSLQRDQGKVTGNMTIKRGDSEFTHEVTGLWQDRTVELQRFTSADTSQIMHGVAIQVGSEQVKMGGRFASELTGVWSADCDLASRSSKPSNAAQQTSSEVVPSTSTQATPFRPTARDKIKFSARATHPDGIEKMSLFVDGKQIHECTSNQCSKQYGPLKPGDHEWHVIATSKTGVANTKQTNTLRVLGPVSGECSVSGLATGAAVAQSASVSVVLEGPDIQRETRFDAGVYQFQDIPAGNYTIGVAVSPASGVLVSPTSTQISCADGQVVQQNFEFR